MRTPYLVQRLLKPIGREVHSFGGGRLNGGINKEAMSLISKVLHFDYMGSAEFEWGAVPTALEALNNKGAVSYQLNEFKKPVFVICLPKDMEDVSDWIIAASKGKTERLKEHLGFREALNNKEFANTVGWLKIEDDRHCKEPFMFFIDETMFKGMCELLGAEEFNPSVTG